MSSCSAAEIAEKKRAALAKLQAKKAQLSNKIATSGDTTRPAINGFQSPKQNGPNTAAPTASNINKSSAFLNALKASGATREICRANAHPYQRSSTNNGNAVEKSPAAIAPVFIKSITCTVYMISADRFAVRPSGYQEQLIQVLKKMPTKNYNSNTRIWDFALRDYETLQKHVLDLKPNVLIGSIPKAVIKLCQQRQNSIEPSCLASIEPTLASRLMPFQQEGVCFAIAQHGRIMICDEMGLGKTYQAIAVADYYRDDWPLLICTTASTRDSWAKHIHELLPNVPLHYVQVLANNQQYVGDAKVLITSYNMMERHIDKLLEHKFQFVIYDESHTLKNGKAKCTAVAKRLSEQAKRVILLSGTPALSRPLELFTQLQLIDNRFMSFMDFTSRYCDGKQTHFGWDANGQSNLDELKVILLQKYMLRRTKAEVLPQLAEKNRETVVLDPALVCTTDETKSSLNAFNEEMLKSKGKEREEVLLRFYARTAEVKAPAVCSYLKSLIKENIKFIIFAHHRVMLNAISECLAQLRVHYIRIDGQTRSDLRADFVETFQKKSSCKVAVLSLKACNSGITLTAAEMIVFAELDWNPSTLAQAESRAHRIGQTKPVVCRYLLAHRTADDTIWNMLKNKQDVLHKVGIFCENLQQATHTAAPTISHKIEDYFSPTKPVPTPAAKAGTLPAYFSGLSTSSKSNNNNEQEFPTPSESCATKSNHAEDIAIAEFFNDDDDEAFKDLLF